MTAKAEKKSVSMSILWPFIAAGVFRPIRIQLYKVVLPNSFSSSMFLRNFGYIRKYIKRKG